MATIHFDPPRATAQEEKGAANVDGDGDVTLDDAFAILSYYSAKAAGKDVNPDDFFGK